MKVKSQIFWFGILAVGMLSGCTGLSADRYLLNKQHFMLEQGDPPAYVAGYIDGCSSGRRLGEDKNFKHRKNSTRFDKDALYARGWQMGQINCRNEVLSMKAHPMPSPFGKKKSAAAPMDPVEAAAQKQMEIEMREIWDELKK
jgi:hypothetical protein